MGVALSFPITSQHVERHSTYYYRASCTHVNGYRNSQEDAHSLQCDLNDTGLCIFAVYDGHGGEKAAQYCAEAMPAALTHITDLNDFDGITAAVLKLDFEFLSTQESDGCTACIVLGQPWNLKDDKPLGSKLTKPLSAETKDEIGMKLLAINIGDSRAILLHPDGSFDQMTDDHKPQDPIERSRIVTAGGHVQNNRVDGSLALSRAIGDAPYKSNPNLPPEQQKVIAVPDYQDFIAHYGDTLLVCCDGIFEAPPMTHERVSQVAHECITELISKSSTQDNGEVMESNIKEFLWDPALVGRRLISESIICDSHDNHTAIIISFTPYPEELPTLTDDSAVDVKAMHKIQSLRLTDTIPGPLYHSNATSFVNAFRTDFGEEVGFPQNDITAIDDAIQQAFDEIPANQLPCECPTVPEFENSYSVPPIMIVYPPKQEESTGGLSQAALSQLILGLMNSRDDQDKDQ